MQCKKDDIFKANILSLSNVSTEQCIIKSRLKEIIDNYKENNIHKYHEIKRTNSLLILMILE